MLLLLLGATGPVLILVFIRIVIVIVIFIVIVIVSVRGGACGMIRVPSNVCVLQYGFANIVLLSLYEKGLPNPEVKI